MKQPTMSGVMALALFGAALGSSVVAVGQDDDARGREEAEAPRLDDEDAVDALLDDEDDDFEADSSIVVEGGEKVKVYRFSGLDISGRLKSPQLLYFLNRMRAEFDRPRLPHRSFIPELVGSTKSKAF